MQHDLNLMDPSFLKPLEPVMTAVSRVFTISELLENILLHLPERRLLLAQRVSKSFRDVTTASVRLQRKLFFTADVDSGDGCIPNLKWNPLLDIFRPANSPHYQISNFTRDWYAIYWCQWLKAHQKSTMGLNDFVSDLSRIQLRIADRNLDCALFGTS